MARYPALVLAGITLLSTSTALLGCNRDGGAGSSGPAPLLDKALASLTKEDFNPLCVKLGWGSNGVSFSNSGGFSSIMASCTKEDPNGTDSPDGKKRARLTIALFRTDALPAKLKELDDKGAATSVDGPHVFAVYLHTKSKSDAQAVLVKLLGTAGASKSATSPAGKAAAPGPGSSQAVSATAPKSTADGSAERPFAIGDAIDIQYEGEWWMGDVKAVKPGPQYHVHYVGWDASWDEWVRPTRVRPRTANARRK